MENRKKTVEELNDILEKTHDSVQGFQKASEKTEDSMLKNYFNQQATTRQRFADELSAEVRSLGGEPKTSGTVKGSLHRSWMNFKAAFSSDNNEELLEEAIRGEKSCIEEYNDLLEETYVPASTRQLLEKQKRSVESTLADLERKEEIYD